MHGTRYIGVSILSFRLAALRWSRDLELAELPSAVVAAEATAPVGAGLDAWSRARARWTWLSD